MEAKRRPRAPQSQERSLQGQPIAKHTQRLCRCLSLLQNFLARLGGTRRSSTSEWLRSQAGRGSEGKETAVAMEEQRRTEGADQVIVSRVSRRAVGGGREAEAEAKAGAIARSHAKDRSVTKTTKVTAM